MPQLPKNDFDNDIFISRSFSLFYKNKPRIAKYIVYLPVEKGQTLHLRNMKKLHISDTCISFITTNKLNTTKRVLKPIIVKYVISLTQPWMSVPVLKVICLKLKNL